jgi:hypothetical protein
MFKKGVTGGRRSVAQMAALQGCRLFGIWSSTVRLPTFLGMSRSPAADLAPLIKLLQAGVPPNRAATELSRVLAIWKAELQGDDEQMQERLSGLAEQMAAGIEEMHEGIAEASDKGKPTLRRILATHEAVLDGIRRAQGAA